MSAGMVLSGGPRRDPPKPIQRSWYVWGGVAMTLGASSVAVLAIDCETGATPFFVALAILSFSVGIYFILKGFQQEQRRRMEAGEIPLKLPFHERLRVVGQALAVSGGLRETAEQETDNDALSAFVAWDRTNEHVSGRTLVELSRLAEAYEFNRSAANTINPKINFDPYKTRQNQLRLADALRYAACRVCPFWLRQGHGLTEQDSQYPRSPTNDPSPRQP